MYVTFVSYSSCWFCKARFQQPKSTVESSSSHLMVALVHPHSSLIQTFIPPRSFDSTQISIHPSYQVKNSMEDRAEAWNISSSMEACLGCWSAFSSSMLCVLRWKGWMLPPAYWTHSSSVTLPPLVYCLKAIEQMLPNNKVLSSWKIYVVWCFCWFGRETILWVLHQSRRLYCSLSFNPCSETTCK